jgi:hypothetical protein
LRPSTRVAIEELAVDRDRVAKLDAAEEALLARVRRNNEEALERIRRDIAARIIAEGRP